MLTSSSDVHPAKVRSKDVTPIGIITLEMFASDEQLLKVYPIFVTVPGITGATVNFVQSENV